MWGRVPANEDVSVYKVFVFVPGVAGASLVRTRVGLTCLGVGEVPEFVGGRVAGVYFFMFISFFLSVRVTSTRIAVRRGEVDVPCMKFRFVWGWWLTVDEGVFLCLGNGVR